MDSSLSHGKSKIAAIVSLCYLTFTSSDSKDRALLILFLILSLRRVGDRVARFPPCVVFVWSSRWYHACNSALLNLIGYIYIYIWELTHFHGQ
ncbi:hypothetical protein DsansV1_C06g0063991 [Dioscorea sansibarensis]